MDLGIAGRTALICASSDGLGRACAETLAAEGVRVIINGRDPDRLYDALAAIRSSSGDHAEGVVGDVTTREGRERLLAACPRPDILVCNSVGPGPGSFADHDEDRWRSALDALMAPQLALVQSVLPSMRARRFGRIVNIGSPVVVAPQPSLTLSAGARTGLLAVLKALSFEVARDNVTINTLIPEMFSTPRQRAMAATIARTLETSAEEAVRMQISAIAARRLGDPAEFGAICAFLCGANSGFTSGQIVHLDGGSYPGLI